MDGFSQSENAGQTLIPVPERRFRLRTVFIPLAFLGIHWVVINLIATVYLVAYIFIQNAAADPLAILGDQNRLNQLLIEHYPVISVLCGIVLIPAYMLYLYLQRRSDGRALWLKKPSVHQVLPSIALTIGVLGLTNLWFGLLVFWGESSPAIGLLIEDYLQKAGSFGPAVGYTWLILGISIVTPITEELIFRGIIQGELRRAMPEWAAVVIQGVIFALFHAQPIQISYVLIPGILLGLVYAWTQSLWIPILMHICFNFLGSVLPSLIGDDEVISQIVIMSEVGFIVIGGLCLVYLYRRRHSPKDSGVMLLQS